MNRFLEQFTKLEINVIVTFGVMVLCWIIIYSADLFSSSGLGEFYLLAIPTIISTFSIGVYFVSRFFFKKYNWILSLIGMLYQLYFAIGYYLK
jgi:hypothetical protein